MAHAPSAVAVIGAACRFPCADSVDAYWQLLLAGKAVAAEPAADRLGLWSVMRDPQLAPRITTLKGGYLRDIAGFDADYFSISPREAARLDPQQRLLLTATHDALEDAGLTREALRGLGVGVFVGAGSNDYMLLGSGSKPAIDAYHGIGNSHGLLANRISYYYNLKGPSLTVDTACSSSLTALHVALQSLERDELDLAIVGGVNVIVSPDLTLSFSQASMLSPTGRCNTFGAHADGYGRAEGVGVIVLARAADVSRFAARARCEIRASALNQDGRSNGISAPNGLSQEQVIRAAMARAGVSQHDLAYMEAHGTGTKLGDAIEFNALREVFSDMPQARCHVGSAKANVGHMEAAAGMGGLLKAMLMLEHGIVPPHAVSPPYSGVVDKARGQLAIAETAVPLREGACIGVSSFGFGGANAHVIVARGEQPDSPPDAAEPAADGGVTLLLLSSHGGELAVADARSLADALESGREPMQAVACTLAYRRDPLRHRIAVAAADRADAVRQLRSKATPADARKPRIAFVFSGQGSQYAGMGASLYAGNASFRDAFDDCAARIRARAGFTVDDLLHGGPQGAERMLADTHLAQLALFCLEHALARLVMAAGVAPAAVIGHSVGEIAAQTVAGMLDLDTAVALVHERARWMQAASPSGAMLAVFATQAAVEDLIARSGLPIHLAALNGAASVTVSGAGPAIASFEAAAGAAGLLHRRLPTRHAFHSPAFAPAAEQLALFTRTLATQPARLPLVSNLDGQLLRDLPPASDYWSRHIVAPVAFARGIGTLVADGFDLFLEIGPDRTLSQLISRDHGAAGVQAVATQRRGEDGMLVLLRALGRLYECHADVRLDPVLPRTRQARVPARTLGQQKFWGLPEPAPGPAAPMAPIAPMAGAHLIALQLDVMRSQLGVLERRRQGHAHTDLHATQTRDEQHG
ncbi:type I polyketide synthase [Ramlibacter sp.]|uniref:type I polyketide synthase n=1 Tax=Ramlibacter sp. TaxID=1917967 RepID=UPI0017E16F0C|nr:type I polyketide synthase [Ramlibacter sp.]MBA2676602.1 type I polyketide synthase [Ramlibacter sp.]